MAFHNIKIQSQIIASKRSSKIPERMAALALVQNEVRNDRARGADRRWHMPNTASMRKTFRIW
jgi:hypothetical protein